MRSVSLRMLLAAAIGVIGWHGQIWGLLAVPIVIWLWRSSQSRFESFLLLLTYYLAAARGLLLGANLFFSESGSAWGIAFAIWMSSSLVMAFVWSCCWGRTHQVTRLFIALVLLIIPPVGIIGWANPLTVAGVLFPSAGAIGLFATLVMFALIARASRLVFFIPLVLLSVFCLTFHTPTALPTKWSAIDTSLGTTKPGQEDFNRLRKLQGLVVKHMRTADEGALLLLPESVGGDWSLNYSWWQRIASDLAARGQTVLIGATRPNVDGGTINMLVSFGADSGKEYAERIPVPVSMWRPWDPRTHFPSDWFGTGILSVAGVKTASLICYEQLLPWPVFLSVLNNPDVFLAPSNGWWASQTSIPAIEKQSISAWGRLFSIPVLTSTNF